jgi:hypothetical protein
VLQRMLRDFTDFPKYLKREANRRRDADSGRIVGKPEVIGVSVEILTFQIRSS